MVETPGSKRISIKRKPRTRLIALITVAILTVATVIGGRELLRIRREKQRAELIAAVQKGDVTAVQPLLDSLVKANIWLPGDMQKPSPAAVLNSMLTKDAREHRKHRTSLLMLGVMSGNEAMVRLLLDRGARVDDGDEYGVTALSIAAAFPKEEQTLIERGADVNAQNETGISPLLWAQMLQQRETMQMLLAHGADPNAHDAEGMPALYLATLNDDTEMVLLLIEKGANPNASFKGSTAISLARAQRNEAIVTALERAGAVLPITSNLPLLIRFGLSGGWWLGLN